MLLMCIISEKIIQIHKPYEWFLISKPKSMKKKEKGTSICDQWNHWMCGDVSK